ncbi:MAG: DUF1573 domain-containing protein [Armatimonadetes bacterium]|nr:DUF1573 domain-containing protein [Armatimonadota bacterium]
MTSCGKGLRLRIALFACFLVVHLSTEQVHAESTDHVLCGPTALLVVCRSLEVPADLEELKRLSAFNEERGTTMLGLKQAAEAKGLRAVGMKIGLEELVGADWVAIAHLWGNHFVVVEAGKDGKLRVTDPPYGPKLVPREQFAEAYSGFALLVAKDEKAFPKTEAKGPDLRCDAYTYDFGFLEQGKQAAHTFKLRNEGTEDLVIGETRASCGCTIALASQQRIPPGGSGELIVTFDSTGRQGGQTHTVFVQSNDPISPVVQLQVGGVVKPARVSVSVRQLSFGTVRTRDGVSREIYIADPGNPSLKVEEAKCDSPFVDVSLTNRPGKEILIYVVKASLRPGMPIGQFAAIITLRTNHAKEPIVEIPVTADVRGDIEASPDMFFFGMLKKGQNLTRTVTLSTTGKAPLEITSVESRLDCVKVSTSAKVKGKEYAVTASLGATALTGNIKGDVVIHTTSTDQPKIIIPLYAFVEE